MRFRPDVLIWVESKHGSPLAEDQLQKYSEELGRRPEQTTALLLIAPDGFERGCDLPKRSAETTWSSVGRHLKLWLKETKPPEDRYDEWLVRQFIAYLREEKLLNDTPIAASTVDLGRRYQTFKDQTDGLLSAIEAQVFRQASLSTRYSPTDNAWKNGTSRTSWPRRHRLFGVSEDLDASLGTSYWLEWRIGNRPDPAGGQKASNQNLVAGLGFSCDAQIAGSIWTAVETSNSDLSLYPDFDGHSWIVGSTDLWDKMESAIALSPGDYQQQVEVMSSWITQCFEEALDACVI